MLVMSEHDDLAFFMYTDDENKPRSAYLEHMFEDLFYDRPLDGIFKANFRTYCKEFFDIESVDGRVFSDKRYALRLAAKFGIVAVEPVEMKHLQDPVFAHCKYESYIQLSKDYRKAYGQKLACALTLAPTEHSAVLIAIVELMREITVSHIGSLKRDSPTLH